MATVSAVTTGDIDLQHYEDYFQWGYDSEASRRKLYEMYDRTVNAEGRGAQSFASLDKEQQTERLRELRRTRAPSVDAVAREVMWIFRRTDALLQIGYRSWPGRPRGFDGTDRLP